MARTAHGYQLRFRSDRGWTIRFRHAGKRVELSTGFRARKDSAAAERKGRELFAEAVQGKRKRRGPEQPAESVALTEVISQWLISIGIRANTRKLYEWISAKWLRRWTWLHEVTAAAIEDYAQFRLSEALGKTVATDISALRGLLKWCVNKEFLAAMPATPRVLMRSGVKSKQRTRVAAPELTPDEIWAVIDALPERAKDTRTPMRARAIVAYLTTLRPATLDKLSVPEHYSKGSSVIRITADIDKESNSREVPLAKEAREALDAVCPDAGKIFGAHDLGRYMRNARKVLPPHKAAVFTWQHFRSAGITHWLERTSNLPGVQYMAGHTKPDTTAKYTRRSFRAALDVVSNRGTARGTAPKKRKKRRA